MVSRYATPICAGLAGVASNCFLDTELIARMFVLDLEIEETRRRVCYVE